MQQGDYGLPPGLENAAMAILRRLAETAAVPELAELARDLLDGKVSLRSASTSSAYETSLVAAISQYRKWDAQLSPDERERVLTETRAKLQTPT